MRRKWTSEEEQILIESYSMIGPKVLAEQLNRNLKSVSKKAIKLGLSRGIAQGNSSRKNTWKFTNWSYDLGYIVGVYLGDGNIYTTKRNSSYFRLSVIDKDFCEAVQTKLKKLTGYSSSLKFNKERKQWTLTFCNRDFVEWIRINFGGANNKRQKVLPLKEANKGMIEGIFDSEGTVIRYSFIIRMQDNMASLQWILFKQLGVTRGPSNKSGRKLNYSNLYSVTVSNREYTRVGLGTYIKHKAKNGIIYKG